MNPLIAFLKTKTKEFDKKETSALNIEIENYAIKNKMTMAKSAQLLNVLQTLKVYENLADFSTKITNALKEEGSKFSDGSIILNNDGRLTGLTLEESSFWEQGIYFKNKIEVASVPELNYSTMVETQTQNKTDNRRKLSL
jgi:hypothetical protein